MSALRPASNKLQRSITLSLLFAAGAVNFFDRSSLSIANNTVRAEMHLSATQMGWLLSAFSLAYGATQLPLIPVLQRVGTRLVFGGGLALWSAAQLLTGFVPGFRAFLGLRVLLGVGEAPFYPAGVQTVREWFPRHMRGRATATMNASQAASLTLAPPLLTSLMVGIGWRATFALLGTAGLLVAAAWFLLYRPAPPEMAEDESTAAGGDVSVWPALLRRRTSWGMMLGFSGINYTNWLYTAWVPGYLQTARHLSLTKTGWVAAVPFLFGGAGMLSNGVLVDALVRRGIAVTTVHRVCLVASMTLSALSTIAVTRAGSTTSAVLCISMALFFIHFAGNSGWGYAQAVSVKRLVASMGALQNFAAFMVASLAPVLTGWLLDRTQSFTLALLLCGGVTLLGALSYATLAAPGKALLGVESGRSFPGSVERGA